MNRRMCSWVVLVVVSLAGYPVFGQEPDRGNPVEPPTPEEQNDVLTPPSSILVKLVDDETGDEIAGKMVLFYVPEAESTEMQRVTGASKLHGCSESPYLFICPAGGSCVRVEKKGYYCVTAFTERHLEKMAWVKVSKLDNTYVLVVRLQRAGSLKFVLRDDKGHPLADTPVLIRGQGKQGAGEDSIKLLNLAQEVEDHVIALKDGVYVAPPDYLGNALYAEMTRLKTTDGDGAFVVGRLYPGNGRFHIFISGYEPAFLPKNEKDDSVKVSTKEVNTVEVMLRKVDPVEVLVLDTEGKPVKDAIVYVEASCQSGDPEFVHRFSYNFSAATDDAGKAFFWLEEDRGYDFNADKGSLSSGLSYRTEAELESKKIELHVTPHVGRKPPQEKDK